MSNAHSEAESQRLDAAAELEAEYGRDWGRDYEPGTFGCHELLDRVHVQADGLERQVLEHPACIHNPAWYELADQAARALHELYQQIAAVHLEDQAGDP